ncbi:MAG: endonuclease/exonuclease/phosphatase family protein [Verrucomicrobiota bacterium]|jgi:endonuclease/exonuclease/phosphatase family metal-dependent hydrolase
MRLLALLLLIPSLGATDAATAPIALELKVMTFNLRYASTSMPHAWSVRRPVTKACLEQTAPDLIGTQEGLAAQLADMRADLPAYAMLGQGREGGDKGEYMAIFYRRDRFELLETHDFWLSETPEVVGSKSWNTSLPRMVTWARFRDKATGKAFVFANTHFDHMSEDARAQSAKLVRARFSALKPESPVLLVGDFNSAAKASAAYTTLTEGGFLTDLYRTAPARSGEDLNTFHGYRKPGHDGVHIDWLLGRGGWQAKAAEVITFEVKGQHPSDHFPVMVKVGLE